MFTTTITFATIVSLIFMALALIPIICMYVEAFGIRNKYKRKSAITAANKGLIIWTVALFVVPCLVIFVACAGQTLAS